MSLPSVPAVSLGSSGIPVSRQVSANLRALAIADQLMPAERDRLAAIGMRR